MSLADKFKKQGAGGNMATRIIREKAIVYGVWVKQPNGDKAYFIVEVDKAKDNEFLKRFESKEVFDFEDYGKLLYKGWSEPDDELKAEFRDKYGLFEEQAT